MGYYPFLARTLHYSILFIFTLSLPHILVSTPPIAKPGCNDTCGNVSIPYPFGMGRNCYHNPWFEVECVGSSKFMLTSLNTSLSRFAGIDDHPQGSRISWLGEQLLTMDFPCTGVCSNAEENFTWPASNYPPDLRNSPFLYSSHLNTFLVVGCGGNVVVKTSRGEPIAGCTQLCQNTSEQFKINHCYGMGCCQTSLPYSLAYFRMDFSVNLCSVPTRAILVDDTWISTKVIDPTLSQVGCPVPVLVEWVVMDLPVHSPGYSNSVCLEKSNRSGGAGGFVCRCKADYYEGNPYLPNGCQVVRECRNCNNSCLSVGNGTFRCPEVPSFGLTKAEKIGLILALGLGIIMLQCVMPFGVYKVYQAWKGKREKKLKHGNFLRNGGPILQQHLSSEGATLETSPRIFNSRELADATDNYVQSRVLGQGGEAIVYKGMLDDGRVVAVKKLKRINERQLNSFVNEVQLLSEVNHRNIVKFMGCCLETEIPLLVYEYVPNGTLSKQLTSPDQDFR